MRVLKGLFKRALRSMGYDVVKRNAARERVIYRAYFRGGCLYCIKGDPLCEEILTGLGWDEQMPEVLDAVRARYGHGDILEVGANIGASIVPLINRYPGFKLYCFEPVPAFHELLQRNIQSYSAKDVVVVKQAVGDVQNARLPIAVGLGTAGAEGTDGKFEVIHVPMTTVDQYVQVHALQPRLFKIDVDGHELKVLRGARNVLEEYRPFVFMEFDLRIMARLGESPKDCIQMFRAHRYQQAHVWDNFGKKIVETRDLDSIAPTVARLPHYANILFTPMP